MVLVAVSMVALIAMAALSIDVVTLYLDREEAQGAADAAALAAARVISVSGITGTTDPAIQTAEWQSICSPTGIATQVAQQVGSVNAISGGAAAHVTVSYSTQGATGGVNDCANLSKSFAINPTVIVNVQQTGLPTMFSRIWSRNTNSVSATAAAEVFNPSDSGTIAPGGDVIPVAPRCVKPLVIPDEDPNPAHARQHLAYRGTGGLPRGGINNINGGVIGETFTITNGCGGGAGCLPPTPNPPSAGANNTYFIPALINTSTPPIAVPSGTACSGSGFQNAILGCDVSTSYQCGTVTAAQVDLSTNRAAETTAGLQCLTNINTPGGNDTLAAGTYPFEITAGSNNPIGQTNQLVTSSNSIMTLPIYDEKMGTNNAVPFSAGNSSPQVTIVGYLQVFVNSIDTTNNSFNVTVMNVAGCGDRATTSFVQGTSPLPIRLITPQ